MSTQFEVFLRPIKRADCLNGSRPCPWAGCKHHMIWAFPGVEKLTDDAIVEKMLGLKETCTLDVADRGGATLDYVGQILGITRERVRQLEYLKRPGRGSPKGAIMRLRHPAKRWLLEGLRGDNSDSWRGFMRAPLRPEEDA